MNPLERKRLLVEMASRGFERIPLGEAGSCQDPAEAAEGLSPPSSTDGSDLVPGRGPAGKVVQQAIPFSDLRFYFNSWAFFYYTVLVAVLSFACGRFL